MRFTPTILLVSFFLLLGSTLGWAQPLNTGELLDTVFNENGELLPEYRGEISKANEEFQNLSSEVQTLFGNQRIYVELKLDDGSVERLGVITQGNTIQTALRHAPANPTLKINADESSIQAIANSTDKAQAFVQAVNQGKLKYEGLNSQATFATFMADLLVFFTNLVNAISQLLGLK
jgi:hypothetical protein